MAKLLFIIAPQDFRDEEYFEPKAILEKAGHTITTASTTTGMIIGSKGGSAVATLELKDVETQKFDAVVFVGGPGSYQYDHNTQAHRIAKEFFASNKLTTAICHAPIILAQAGILASKKATVYAGDVDELIKFGVTYIDKAVVNDDILVTADGPSSAKTFAQVIVSALAPS